MGKERYIDFLRIIHPIGDPLELVHIVGSISDHPSTINYVRIFDNNGVPVVDTHGRPVEYNLIRFYPTISREATQEIGEPNEVLKIMRALDRDLQIVFERGVFKIKFLDDILFKAYLNKSRVLSIKLNKQYEQDALHNQVESDIYLFNCPLLYPFDPAYDIKLRVYLEYDFYGIYELLKLKDIGSIRCRNLLKESIVPMVKIIGKAPRGGQMVAT